VPTQRITRRQIAYRHVLRRLVARGFPVGQTVREVQLAKELRMSRAPIREALHQLANEGWLQMIPGRGGFVREHSRREIIELFDLRQCLEAYAAYRAATRIKSSELAQLDDTCRAMSEVLREVKDGRFEKLSEPMALKFARADTVFHTVIGKASRNQQLQASMRNLRLLVRSVTHQPDPSLFHLLTVLTTVYKFHRRVISSLRRKDAAGARRWMNRYVRESKRRFLKQLNSPTAEFWPPSVLDMVSQAHTS
jgi:DNA-binding GntR family transcriptional regulator